MKTIVRATMFALFLLTFATLNPTNAQTPGTSADGSFKFSMDNDYFKTMEFRAFVEKDGSTTGSMIFSGPETIPDQNVDGDDNKEFSGRLASLDMEVDLDTLVVDKNKAVMSGTIRSCNIYEYVGRRVLLTVEDNGDGTSTRALDKFTWGFYRTIERTWVPTDAEQKEDKGAYLRWWATDAERKDDIGYEMPRQNDRVDTRTFPNTAYSLINIEYGDGGLTVRP
ncbi:MAG TPA: hypothetical protein VIQ24_17555 [Pyrinomonadaceae bacterium]